VLSVNRIFPLRVLTAVAISLFLNITGAIAPVAPVLNMPLISVDRSKSFVNKQKIVVLEIFFSCLKTLDLATLMLLHTAPPIQTAL